MITFPNAKINLGLNIVSRRDNGYHNLESVFYPLPLMDSLEFIVHPQSSLSEDRFSQHGLVIDGNLSDNLVMKALRLIRRHYSIPSLEVVLLKKIPFGAGLGGGSADASFMLRMLNTAFHLGISDSQLAEWALELGADCPFFIYNTPAFVTGIGEHITPVDLSLKNYCYVLINPKIHISTKVAFADIQPRQPQHSLRQIIEQPVENWRDLMHNDFEQTIFKAYPEIEKIKQQLYDLGAVYASMTGSGSSVYGIFKQLPSQINDIFKTYYVHTGQML